MDLSPLSVHITLEIDSFCYRKILSSFELCVLCKLALCYKISMVSYRSKFPEAKLTTADYFLMS